MALFRYPDVAQHCSLRTVVNLITRERCSGRPVLPTMLDTCARTLARYPLTREIDQGLVSVENSTAVLYGHDIMIHNFNQASELVINMIKVQWQTPKVDYILVIAVRSLNHVST